MLVWQKKKFKKILQKAKCILFINANFSLTFRYKKHKKVLFDTIVFRRTDKRLLWFCYKTKMDL